MRNAILLFLMCCVGCGVDGNADPVVPTATDRAVRIPEAQFKLVCGATHYELTTGTNAGHCTTTADGAGNALGGSCTDGKGNSSAATCDANGGEGSCTVTTGAGGCDFN